MMATRKLIINRIVGPLHRWLGLGSGLVVFVVAITGCLYAFQAEIQALTQPYRSVAARDEPFLPPSTLREIADAELPGKHIHGILYQGPAQAARAIYYEYEEYYDFVYLNPYTGEVLRVKDETADFFRIVLDGHFYLWLPPNVGQPVVASFTLIFVVMLISGLVLWWPRNKKERRKSFTIKWDARWRRKNYDLHRVLGIYVYAIALILALTGLVWGFEWFRDGLYAAAGGSKSLEYAEPLSDTTARATVAFTNPVDVVWERTRAKFPAAESIEMHFPATAASPIHVAVNPDASTYWQIDYLYYDQYTLEEVPAAHLYSRFADATAADKLIRMNYDIHTGAVLGLPGKLLACLASLLVASLPVTGLLIWVGRRKKKKSARGLVQREEKADKSLA